jgi:hypothetical protein
MIGDQYYGDKAAGYDDERSNKPGWQAEQSAVAEFLSGGYASALDVPFGTGRFVPIYRTLGIGFAGIDKSSDMLAQARWKYPGVTAGIGDVLDLPFPSYPARVFDVAVCTRMLVWFDPACMTAAIAELRRVACNLIVSIRLGEEGTRCHRGSYTHSGDRFFAAMNGMQLAGRRETARTDAGVFAVFKCVG